MNHFNRWLAIELHFVFVIQAIGVYENAPDDRPYATIKKSSIKSNDMSQSDPIYQNLHFNTSQGDDIYGNLQIY